MLSICISIRLFRAFSAWVCLLKKESLVRVSLVCTRMWSVCHSYVLLCNSYVTRMYSYVNRMSFAWTRMSLVCSFIMNLCACFRNAILQLLLLKVCETFLFTQSKEVCSILWSAWAFFAFVVKRRSNSYCLWEENLVLGM